MADKGRATYFEYNFLLRNGIHVDLTLNCMSSQEFVKSVPIHTQTTCQSEKEKRQIGCIFHCIFRELVCSKADRLCPPKMMTDENKEPSLQTSMPSVSPEATATTEGDEAPSERLSLTADASNDKESQQNGIKCFLEYSELPEPFLKDETCAKELEDDDKDSSKPQVHAPVQYPQEPPQEDQVQEDAPDDSSTSLRQESGEVSEELKTPVKDEPESTQTQSGDTPSNPTSSRKRGRPPKITSTAVSQSPLKSLFLDSSLGDTYASGRPRRSSTSQQGTTKVLTSELSTRAMSSEPDDSSSLKGMSRHQKKISRSFTETNKLSTALKREKEQASLSTTATDKVFASVRRTSAIRSDSVSLDGESSNQQQVPALDEEFLILPGRKKKLPISAINVRDRSGRTLLFKYSAQGDTETVLQLIQAGALVNIKDYAGWSPLHEACLKGHEKTIRALIGSGANVNIKGGNGDTPLHDAIQNGDAQVSDILLSFGASWELKNDDGESPLDFVDSENEELSKVIQNWKTLPEKACASEEDGRTWLHSAVARGKIEEAKDCLKYGADIQAKDNTGWTALHDAALLGNVQICEFLLSHGAQLNTKGVENETALHNAAINDHYECVKLLLKFGARSDIADIHGRKPIDLTSSDEIKKLLFASPRAFEPLLEPTFRAWPLPPVSDCIQTEESPIEQAEKENTGDEMEWSATDSNSKKPADFAWGGLETRPGPFESSREERKFQALLKKLAETEQQSSPVRKSHEHKRSGDYSMDDSESSRESDNKRRSSLPPVESPKRVSSPKKRSIAKSEPPMQEREKEVYSRRSVGRPRQNTTGDSGEAELPKKPRSKSKISQIEESITPKEVPSPSKTPQKKFNEYEQVTNPEPMNSPKRTAGRRPKKPKSVEPLEEENKEGTLFFWYST